MNTYYVYILASKFNGTIYIGVTNDLSKRYFQHTNKVIRGFTSKYNVNRLVYYEDTPSIEAAIKREKQIKGWTRIKKNNLIKEFNPTWKFLNDEI